MAPTTTQPTRTGSCATTAGTNVASSAWRHPTSPTRRADTAPRRSRRTPPSRLRRPQANRTTRPGVADANLRRRSARASRTAHAREWELEPSRRHSRTLGVPSRRRRSEHHTTTTTTTTTPNHHRIHACGFEPCGDTLWSAPKNTNAPADATQPDPGLRITARATITYDRTPIAEGRTTRRRRRGCPSGALSNMGSVVVRAERQASVPSRLECLT